MRRVASVSILVLAAAACGKGQGSGSTAPTRVTLQITAGGGGLVRGAGLDCPSACSTQLDKGSQVHLQAIADAGSAFTAWSGACSGTAGCDLTLNADASVTALFAPNGPPPPPPSHQLKVTIEGSGRVTSSPEAIDCTSGTCSATYPEGAAVALTATPGAGAAFTGWGSGCSGPGACAVVMSADLHVYAHFDPLPPPPPPPQFKLTVAVTGPGAITGGGLSCGNGGNTCAVTVPAGTHVSLVAASAALARFSGWSGACSGAAGCDLTLNADTAVQASFEFLLQTLVPNDGSAVFVLALNSKSVFYCRNLSDGYSIWSVPKAGGTPIRVAPGLAANIVADDAFVYWTDRQAIYSAPVGGGTASQLATAAEIGKLALDTDGSLWWVEVASGTRVGAVHHMQNRVDRIIVANTAANYGVAVDDTDVYFTSNAPGADGYVIRARKDGTGTTHLVGYASHTPLLVRVDAANIYFRTWMGAVYVVPKAGGATRLLSTENTDSGSLSTIELDVNASVAWWNWQDGTSAPRGIFKSGADGTGSGAVDTGAGDWFGPRVDDSALYYWHAGALLKRLK